MIRKWIFGGIVFALLLGMTGVTSAQEKKMTREEYDAQLLDSQTRETNANAEIEKTDLQIADLKSKIEATEVAIKALQGDIRGLVISRYKDSAGWRRCGLACLRHCSY